MSEVSTLFFALVKLAFKKKKKKAPMQISNIDSVLCMGKYLG